MTKVINGTKINNMPWEERPAGHKDVFWRSEKNPIITKDLVNGASTILNSAAVVFGDVFAGVFRVDDRAYHSGLHVGFSKNGYDWEISDKEIEFIRTNDEIPEFNHGYDPRVCKIDDKYYIVWCNKFTGKDSSNWSPTIGCAYTKDFKTFYQLENAFLPENRNGVLFPRKIDGKYMMLSRPIFSGNVGDIYLSQSNDMEFWGRHRLVMTPASNWESNKIGGGPTPIEIDEGWLLLYHGVISTCNGLRYMVGAAILDRDKPWIVKHRSDKYLMAPETEYERYGDVDNVVFPCACLVDAPTGRIAMYYGCADTVVGIAYTTVDDVVKFIKDNDVIK